MYLELRIYETYTDQWREYAVSGGQRKSVSLTDIV